MKSTRILITLFLVTFADGSDPLNNLRKCTATNCGNEHAEIVEEIDGPVYRYSKNAAKFNEARSLSDRQAASPHGARQPMTTDGSSGASTSVHSPSLSRDQTVNHIVDSQNSVSGVETSGINQAPDHVDKSSIVNVQAVDEGIFWSSTVEKAIPPGLSDTEVEVWSQRLRRLKVVKVENATLSKCGGHMNRHVVFDDGTTSCARYRHPLVHLVLGDLYSYYLSRMLGMTHVPTIVLSKVSNSSSQWSAVAEDIGNAGWTDNTLASLSLWIDDLKNAELPEILVANQHTTITRSTQGFEQLNVTQLAELAQYSDLFIFDYITAHQDRMTIRKNAVHHYQDKDLYKGEVHNLSKHKINGGLWYIDNENGIFSSYSIIQGHLDKDVKQGYMEEILRSLCIFRRSTVASVSQLAQMDDPFQMLNETVHAKEPAINDRRPYLVFHPPNIHEVFKERLTQVVKFIETCKLNAKK